MTQAPPESGPLNLRNLVTYVMAYSALADPGDIADQVMKHIPEEQSREALEQTLRLYVQNTIGIQRMRAKQQPAPPDLDDLGSAFISSEPELEPFNSHHDVPDMGEVLDGAEEPVEAPARPVRPPGWSPKMAARREMFRERLALPYRTAERWKTLAEFTVADLWFTAEALRDQAARDVASAEEKEALVPLLEEHGVELVGDLPEDVLRQVLGAGDASA